MATFNIYSVSTKRPMRVTGLVIGAFGVHHAVLVNFAGGRKYDSSWTVTHIPTGHRIQTFHKRSDALRLAKALTDPSWRSPHWRFGEPPRGKANPPKFYAAAKAEALAALKQFKQSDFV